ncbi:kinase-like domain-containing protein [Mycena galericulata]|nr:kinase-like domain-containing protein [Mycena galericulata]
MQYYNVVDATCIEDDKKVVLKKVASDSVELAILQYLSKIPDPRNRTIPLLKIIPLPPDNSQSLLVMPFTRRFNHPPFHCRAEFLEAMRSFLEGLQFMHDNHVCHFDIAPQNLMMDETRVVPAGSHFCRPESHTGLPGVFSWENRCSVGPVDYYYIDFGLSMYFPEGKDAALITATLRTFPTIPELSPTVPYNPFKVDIFQLGLTMQKLIKTYPALSAFRPVAQRMMSPSPRDRPDPADSLAQLNGIAARISSHKLSAPILEKKGVARYLARNLVPRSILLLSAGYRLRARYQPDWIPSWANTTKPGEYEDSLRKFLDYNVLDAVRIQDDLKVVLKRVETDSQELKISKHLSSLSGPRNHTIPLLDIIPLPPNKSSSILVMPYTRRFNHPAFHCRAEFIEAMQQFLEGLQFMHENNICHFDIAPQNLMMDESRVVPAGSRFCYPRSHTGFPGLFSWENRCSVGPVDYYYIDFGLSMHFPDGKDTALTTGTLRTFKTIPELSLTVPYNPFKVDIFQLGLTMHKLIEAYPALSAFPPWQIA